MKTIVCVCLFALVAVALARPNDEPYTTKHDSINLDEILQNKRLLLSYFKCLMVDGPCTAEGTELKANITDALQTECAKCSEKQKSGVEKVIGHLYHHEKEMWEELKAKYDPEGKYSAKYEEKFKQIQEKKA
uniref:Chemosensory protein n=1 Tax=Semiothisa cinerearia TaxID=2249628 RepID=A0A889XL64_9NEOP|nr:chemosensory protein [Semiothisa cinerearia]